MKPFPETFVFTAELGARLRDLRLKAGLTQLELARAMGRAGKNAGSLVRRLERPHRHIAAARLTVLNQEGAGRG